MYPLLYRRGGRSAVAMTLLLLAGAAGAQSESAEKALAQLVKDVVVSFQLHAVGNSGLFQQVGLNIGTSNTKDVGKVNTNEFTL